MMEGPMNGPVVEGKPELVVDARIQDSYGDDTKYRAERKASQEKRSKMLADAIKGMTPEKAHAMVMASLKKEQKRCEIDMMEYEDDGSVGDAFDEDDQADGKKK